MILEKLIVYLVAIADERTRCYERIAELEELLKNLHYQLTDGGWANRHGHTIEMNVYYQQLDAALAKGEE